jgi:hypothetical protein
MMALLGLLGSQSHKIHAHALLDGVDLRHHLAQGVRDVGALAVVVARLRGVLPLHLQEVGHVLQVR